LVRGPGRAWGLDDLGANLFDGDPAAAVNVAHLDDALAGADLAADVALDIDLGQESPRDLIAWLAAAGVPGLVLGLDLEQFPHRVGCGIGVYDFVVGGAHEDQVLEPVAGRSGRSRSGGRWGGGPGRGRLRR